jgi:hypothetical protein
MCRTEQQQEMPNTDLPVVMIGNGSKTTLARNLSGGVGDIARE